MITSKDNKLIKYVKALLQKKYRDLNHEYIVEGVKIVKEAIENDEKISHIILCEEILSNILDKEDSIYKLLSQKEFLNIVEYVSKGVLESISDTKTPQGIILILFLL